MDPTRTHPFKLHTYRDRDTLAEALASGVAAVLAGAVASRGSASLAVSGGSTPKRFFEHLSRRDIAWDCVTITLVDERWVPETNPRSNAAMLREHLLQGRAAAAVFEPLYIDAAAPEDVAGDLDDRFHRLARPFDAVILGMGTDGHTASFFPGGDRLAEAIDPETRRSVVAMRAEGAGEPRVTLTLPMMADARFLALHIEGDEKKAVLDEAAAPGPIEDMPIRAVLGSKREQPLDVFWAP